MLCVFCALKDSMQRIIINKYFPFTVGSVYHVRRCTTSSRNVTSVSLLTKEFKGRGGSG
jgi:hypothetical protein